jgi:glutathione synthase/RimK-type ligase-like ATP-grasp enzyme
VRVHVVGTQAFATEIRSSAVDYRYASRTGADAELVACGLPPEVASKCVALAHELDLPLCGIDLRRRPDGSFVCFEVNPMPGFSYYEHSTGQGIGEAVVSYLAEG